MPTLGKLQCNRCRLVKIQDEASRNKMAVTMRKSLYGLKHKEPGIDVYVHPQSMEIPSHYKLAHGGKLETIEVMSRILPDDDPEKWFRAWFPGMPPKCVCKNI